MNLVNTLFKMQDLSYRDFSARLMPTVPKDKVIGIRTPLLRSFAKSFSKTSGSQDFINALPHNYFEENNLHAFILEGINDFDLVVQKTEEFLPYIDNWATCDSFLPNVFKKNRTKLLKFIKTWLKSEHPYTVRYAIGLLMKLYLDDNFDTQYPHLVASVKSDEYYVKMMIAWYFATALAKQYNTVISYIQNNDLDAWTHNKTIQKACESNRIPHETKKYLKSLKF